MVINDKLLDEITIKAEESPRLRMNHNFHENHDSKAQRLINVLLPGTIIPVHRHRHTAETYALLRGKTFVTRKIIMAAARIAQGKLNLEEYLEKGIVK